MSAETLREVVRHIRSEWDDSGPKPLGTAWHRERDFHLAVADWLAACALIAEVAPHRHRAHALAVARAYLGTEVSA
jgi:hypothetical protein